MSEQRHNTIVCEDTGLQELPNGSCPVHGGDSCLWDVSRMRDIYNNHVTLKGKIKMLLEEDQSGTGRC